MDETRREALEAELADLIAERQKIDSLISYLSARLGVTAPEQSQSMVGAGATPTSADAEPTDLVNPGEFYGFSAPKAARTVLERIGRTRPLSTRVLLAAIRKGGVKLGGKSPEGGLYRSLDRDDTFMRVGRGIWGLTEWYPARSRKTKRNGADQEQLIEEEQAENES
jgi:hypothetical protein